MKKQYTDPVNYKLTEEDLKDTSYGVFLDELTDVPSSIALKPFSIDKAGIVEQSAYIKINSIDGSKAIEPILITVRMQVELKGHRGIHMSRCEEAMFSLLEETHNSLDSFTEQLAKKILKLQSSDKAFVYAEGIYVHKTLTKKTRKTSYDKMTLRATTMATKGDIKSNIGLSAYNMTGCPCTETFTKFAVVPKLKKAGYNLNQISEILDITNSGTHTQRGIATLNVDKTSPELTYDKLYEVLDASCHLVYELLKRPDEHELVVRVLKKPQFTEDVVREIADNLIKKFSDQLNDDTSVFISSQLFDSIHIHDVYTEINKKYKELIKENA